MLSISELSISEFQVPISNTFEVSLPAVPQAYISELGDTKGPLALCRSKKEGGRRAPKPLYSNLLNSTQLYSTLLNSIQLYSTRFNATHFNSPLLNSTKLYSTLLNSTQLKYQGKATTLSKLHNYSNKSYK